MSLTRVVKKLGNSGYVPLPKEFIGKMVEIKPIGEEEVKQSLNTDKHGCWTEDEIESIALDVVKRWAEAKSSTY